MRKKAEKKRAERKPFGRKEKINKKKTSIPSVSFYMCDGAKRLRK